jgi:hypothetical protein
MEWKSDNRTKHEGNEDDVVVDLSKQAPLNDINCKHFFVKDSEVIGEFRAWICKHCKRGTFIRKDATIKN